MYCQQWYLGNTLPTEGQSTWCGQNHTKPECVDIRKRRQRRLTTTTCIFCTSWFDNSETCFKIVHEYSDYFYRTSRMTPKWNDVCLTLYVQPERNTYQYELVRYSSYIMTYAIRSRRSTNVHILKKYKWPRAHVSILQVLSILDSTRLTLVTRFVETYQCSLLGVLLALPETFVCLQQDRKRRGICILELTCLVWTQTRHSTQTKKIERCAGGSRDGHNNILNILRYIFYT
jgi:hypothetical protein